MSASTLDGDTVADVADAIHVVVYGDFNCPFSALAHRRATQQHKDGLLRVEWRAVEHDPEIPLDGVPVDTRTHDQLEEELGQIRGLLVDGEADVLRVPSRRPNTSRLNALYASTPIAERSDFGKSVFDAYWVDDRDLNSAEFVKLRSTLDTAAGASTAKEWQREWESFDRRIVPMMRLPDGKLSRGLGVLARLQ